MARHSASEGAAQQGPTSKRPTTERQTGLPRHVIGYIVAVSWVHQLPLLALTVGAFLLEVVPLELQRRIVNDTVRNRQFRAVVILCIVYAGVVLVQGATKLGMNIYRNWIAENAKRDLRRRVCGALGGAGAAMAETQGVAVSVMVAEVEPIGGFVGSAVSEPLLQAGVLVTVLAYIVHVDVWMAVAALALFMPQFVFVPLMQQAMNRRTGARVRVLRQIGGGIIAHHEPAQGCHPADRERIDRVLQLNMGIAKLKFTMNFLMNLCSHLQVVAALLLGGWWVLQGRLEIGGVVAFISGMGRLTDPWGDLVNYFREVSVTSVKYRLLATAVNRFAGGKPGGTMDAQPDPALYRMNQAQHRAS